MESLNDLYRKINETESSSEFYSLKQFLIIDVTEIQYVLIGQISERGIIIKYIGKYANVLETLIEI